MTTAPASTTGSLRLAVVGGGRMGAAIVAALPDAAGPFGRGFDGTGPGGAITGPIARGDEGTVARRRAAIESRRADLLPLFDALCDQTRSLVARGG